MTGAAELCARAAYRAGAGMVRLGVPGADPAELPAGEAVGAAPARRRAGPPTRSTMAAAVPGPRGRARASGRADDDRGRRCGPLVAAAAVPMVVDADGLVRPRDRRRVGRGRAAPSRRGRRRPAVVLTPHDGEFARLAGGPPGPTGSRRPAALAGALRRGGAAQGADHRGGRPGGDGAPGHGGLAPAGHGRDRRRPVGRHRRLPRPGRRPAPTPPRLAAHVHGRAAALGLAEGLVAGDLADLRRRVAVGDPRGERAGDGRRCTDGSGRARRGPRSTSAPSGTTPRCCARSPRPAALCAVVKADAYGHGAVRRGPGRARGRGQLAGGGHGRGGRGAARRAASTPRCSCCPSRRPRPWPRSWRDGLTPTALHAPAAWPPPPQAARARRASSSTSTSRWTPACTAWAPTRPSCSAVVAAVAAEPSLALRGAVDPFRGGRRDRRARTAPSPTAQLELLRRARAPRCAAAGRRAPVLHAANSAGAIAYPAARLDMVRCGIALYGVLALPGARRRVGRRHGRPPARRPAPGAVAARPGVAACGALEAGERPSYGRRSPAARAVDGGDRAPRLRRRRPPALLHRGRYGAHRRPAPPAGRHGHHGPDRGGLRARRRRGGRRRGGAHRRQGDEALTASDWAEVLGTIAYEVFCGIGPRVPRVVVGRGRADR